MDNCPKCRKELTHLIQHVVTDEKAKISLKEGHRLIENQIRQSTQHFECPHCDFVLTKDLDEALRILRGG